jgi:hypothetical protein
MAPDTAHQNAYAHLDNESYDDRVARIGVGYSLMGMLCILRELHVELGAQIKKLNAVRAGIRTASVTEADANSIRDISLEFLRIGSFFSKHISPELRAISRITLELSK